jgi:hypothetical protein
MGRIAAGNFSVPQAPAAPKAAPTLADTVVQPGAGQPTETKSPSPDDADEIAPGPIKFDQPVTKQTAAQSKAADSAKTIAGTLSGGTMTKNKSGGFTYTPPEPGRGQTPEEAARIAANERGMRSLPSESDLLQKRKDDADWVKAVSGNLIGALADSSGQSPDPTLLAPLATLIDTVRSDLESRGVSPEEARQYAVASVVKKYRDSFTTNYELWAKNRIEKKTGDKADIAPQEVADQIKTSLQSDSSLIPNAFIDQAKYVTSGTEWFNKNVVDISKVPPNEVPTLQAQLNYLEWMRDVVKKAPANGYKYSVPSNVGPGQTIKIMKDPEATIRMFQDRINQYEQHLTQKYKK